MSFHTITYHDIVENYVVSNYGKVYLVDGKPLDIVGKGDIHLKMLDKSV